MIFISHSNLDADFVRDLKRHLTELGLDTWVDRYKLVAGGKLAPEIEQAIDDACFLLAVISQNTVNSKWVTQEINYALAKEQQDSGFKVIPLLLKDITTDALDTWFEEEPVAISLDEQQPGALLEILPQILAALGIEDPHPLEKLTVLPDQPLEDLILELEEPEINTTADKRQQFTAKAKLIYEPADAGKGQTRSEKFRFIAPLGAIELDELRWYLEQYHIWPAGEFKKRAENIAKMQPDWGQALYQAALANESAKKLDNLWRAADGQHPIA